MKNKKMKNQKKKLLVTHNFKIFYYLEEQNFRIETPIIVSNTPLITKYSVSNNNITDSFPKGLPTGSNAPVILIIGNFF